MPTKEASSPSVGTRKWLGNIEIVAWFFLWYGASVYCNNSSKELSPILGSGRVLTLIQLILSSFLGFSLLSSGLGGLSVKSCNDFQKEIWLLGATFAGSFLCFNVGTQYMHVSMAMVLRATEPLFAVAILMLRGGSVSLKIFCSLIMIVVGAGMSAFNESNLSLTGLGLLVVSNIGFTFRSILAKGIKDKHRGLDNINIFFHCCWRGAIVQSIIVALLDADVVLTLYTSGAIHSGLIYKAIMNGIAYFVYLQSSFIILSKMGVVSHTVGNSLRRPVCIGFAVVYFQNKVTEMAIMGIVLACVGAGAYSVFKATEIKKKEHSK